MNDDKLARELENIISNLKYDTETMHIRLDERLIEFLKEEGYDESADIYENVEKWYA